MAETYPTNSDNFTDEDFNTHRQSALEPVTHSHHPVNPLRPSGNYMNHLILQSVMLHFVFIGFAWFSM
jgi:hypothetical protein